MYPDTLRGQVAIVTGGGRGIGRAISLKLASAGMPVAVLARNTLETGETVELAERAGGVAQAYTADVTDMHSLRAALTQIERDLGPVQLLVNNAGQVGPIGPFHEADLASWWRTLEVNLFGAAQCTHAVLRGMIDRQEGRIVNIVASVAPFAYLTSYVTSKAALMKFTETIAAEVEPHGIGAFALVPGTVRTPLSEQSLTSVEGRKWLPWFGRIFTESLDVPAERPASLVLQIARGRVDALSGRVISVWDDLDTLISRATEIKDRKLYSLRVNALPVEGANRVLDEIRCSGELGQRYVLKVERLISASPADVFTLWTDPAAVHQWFIYSASVHWHAPLQLDARPGGGFDWCVVRDTNEREVFHFTGSFLEIRPHEKLAFTWDWQNLPIEGVGGPGRTVLEITFVQERNNTRVTLSQSGFANQAARAAHQKGWERCLEGIAELLSRREAEAS